MIRIYSIRIQLILRTCAVLHYLLLYLFVIVIPVSYHITCMSKHGEALSCRILNIREEGRKSMSDNSILGI